MIVYNNTKVNIRSPDGDTDFFDIVTIVLQGDTLAPNLFIIRQDSVLRTALLAKTESLLYSLEKTAGSIGLPVNADKTEFICFNQNQTRDIYSLTGSSLKLVDKFTNHGSSVTSTENDINTRRAKVWSAIDRLYGSQADPIK